MLRKMTGDPAVRRTDRCLALVEGAKELTILPLSLSNAKNTTSTALPPNRSTSMCDVRLSL